MMFNEKENSLVHDLFWGKDSKEKTKILGNYANNFFMITMVSSKKTPHTCIYLCNIVFEDVRVCIFKFAIFFCNVLEYFGDQNCHFFRFREIMYSCYAK